jgi:unsaturated pyranuronate lyase
VEGVAHRLQPGTVYTIRSNASHSARAVTPCRVFDVFNPVREDFR